VQQLERPAPTSGYAGLRREKVAQARTIEDKAHPQLRPGIKLSVSFTDPAQDATDAKLDFHVRVAPNDTDGDGSVLIEPSGPPTPIHEVPQNFYHGTDKRSADILASDRAVDARGHGEFGSGFYMFNQQEPAEAAAAQYTRNRGAGPQWGVVNFGVPVDVLRGAGLLEAVSGLASVNGYVLTFSDQTTPTSVRYPDDLGGIERTISWKEFRDENRRLGGHVSWPYDLIIGPLSGKLAGFRNVNQFLFNEQGIYALNDPRVRRRVVAVGET